MCYLFEKGGAEKMKKYKNVLLLSLLFLLTIPILTFTGCDLDDLFYIPGSTLPPKITDATPMTLPDNVTVTSISGSSENEEISSYPITIKLSNSASRSVTVKFSAGSNFWCENDSAQNLIIVYDVSIKISAGETITEDLPTYCLNSGLDAPDEEDSFVVGTVYTDGCIGEIIDILSDKDPSKFDSSEILFIQKAVWECMDNGKLTSFTLEQLEDL